MKLNGALQFVVFNHKAQRGFVDSKKDSEYYQLHPLKFSFDFSCNRPQRV